MKGIILSEFIEYIEQELGESAAQKIIDQSELESEGAYSRVGLYDYQELISLLTNTASLTYLPCSKETMVHSLTALTMPQKC